jgi:hypothetical protein
MMPMIVIGRIINQLTSLFAGDLTGISFRSLTNTSFVRTTQNIMNDASAFLFTSQTFDLYQDVIPLISTNVKPFRWLRNYFKTCLLGNNRVVGL